MIKLKKVNEIFTYGIYDLLCEEDPQIYAYTRTLDGEKVIVLANLSEQTAIMSDEIGVIFTFSSLLLNNYEVPRHEQMKELTLKPYETRIYYIR